MFPLGHVGIALLFVAPIALLLERKQRYPPVAALALATALLPDVDGKIPFSHHHGGPHTVLFAFSASLAIGLALAFVSANVLWLSRRIDGVPAFRPRAAFALGFAGAIAGLGSHLFADLLMIPIEDNPVEPLWPFSERPVALGLMHPATRRGTMDCWRPESSRRRSSSHSCTLALVVLSHSRDAHPVQRVRPRTG